MKIWTLTSVAAICAVIATLAVTSTAKSPETHHARVNYGKVVSAAALNAASTTVSFTPEQIGGYGILALYFYLDYTAATAVAMTCTGSPDRGTGDFILQSCEVSSGACTSYDSSWSKAISAADKRWVWKVDILGLDEVECVITDTNGGASDLLDVHAVAMNQ